MKFQGEFLPETLRGIREEIFGKLLKKSRNCAREIPEGSPLEILTGTPNSEWKELWKKSRETPVKSQKEFQKEAREIFWRNSRNPVQNLGSNIERNAERKAGGTPGENLRERSREFSRGTLEDISRSLSEKSRENLWNKSYEEISQNFGKNPDGIPAEV